MFKVTGEGVEYDTTSSSYSKSSFTMVISPPLPQITLWILCHPYYIQIDIQSLYSIVILFLCGNEDVNYQYHNVAIVCKVLQISLFSIITSFSASPYIFLSFFCSWSSYLPLPAYCSVVLMCMLYTVTYQDTDLCIISLDKPLCLAQSIL